MVLLGRGREEMGKEEAEAQGKRIKEGRRAA